MHDDISLTDLEKLVRPKSNVLTQTSFKSLLGTIDYSLTVFHFIRR